MKVWITKYALSQGIFDADVQATSIEGMVEHKQVNTYNTYYHKGDYYLSLKEAQKKAEQMRVKRIAGLQKSIKKLESLTF